MAGDVKNPADWVAEALRNFINEPPLHPGIDQYVESHFGFKGYGCCFCQTGVPCESENPVKQSETNEIRGSRLSDTCLVRENIGY